MKHMEEREEDMNSMGRSPVRSTVLRGGKTARLELRLRTEQKQLLEKAAALQGSSLTDFVTASLETAAARVVQLHEVLELTARDSEAFAAALLSPPPPSLRLFRAAERYAEEMAR
jgi:uncharacterized protein (DUF1778 family)